jgi:hypothetical protein
VFQSSDCSGAGHAFIGGGTCSSTGFNGIGFQSGSAVVTASNFEIDSINPTQGTFPVVGTCSPTVAAPASTGTVVGLGAITVCCR